ncbi:MAG: hypothetical protein OFPI_24240 [Osedax symbiont Rs2]|nr:MAG: hypothetical protein OFPI_24240 [Osedax symbiont Rs2]
MPLLKYVLIAVSLFASFASQAKELKIAIGVELPPYVLNQNSAGIEVDIITEALKVKGHTVSFHFIPNLRLPGRLKNREVDASAQNAYFDIGKEINTPVYDSATTINYHNFAIAFSDRNFQIQSVADLAGKRVLAFKNATKYLGTEFAEMAKGNDTYKEEAKQSNQVKQLYAGRVEVVISEKRIFNYWKHQAETQGELLRKNKGKQLQFHTIFDAAPRNVKFLERETRDDFNEGLKFIKASGLYYAIIKKYENM